MMRRRSTKMEEPEALASILSSVMDRMGLTRAFREREVVERWPDLVGENLARNFKALRIHQGVLYLHSESSAWSQELHFIKAKLLSRLEEEYGPGMVKDIRVSAR
jgi:predicted nucleic acid-binding Zn ribbon protein